MATLKKDGFQKSLARLQDMAKGSQLHHTASDSNPGAWPGGSQEDLDEHESRINDNGTDYDGVRKSLADKIRKSEALTPAEVAIADGANPLPAIQGKLAKGQRLTDAEAWALKGGYDATSGTFLSKASTKPKEGAPMSGEDDDAGSVPETNAGGKEGEIEADAKKSFDGAVSASLELQKGLELSPFLYEFANAIGSALSGSEDRITKSLAATIGGLAQRVEAIEKSQSAATAAQDEFNKSLADAVVGIGESVGATAEATAASAQMPVGAPKSQMRQTQATGNLNVMNKSYDGPGGLDMNMSKAVISDALVELVKSNEVQPLEVVRFETTSDLLPATRAKVEALVRGGN
jgi:hypothetical protein